MKTLKTIIVAGARPNFMKVLPVLQEAGLIPMALFQLIRGQKFQGPQEEQSVLRPVLQQLSPVWPRQVPLYSD